jgi:hypothetical protein
MNAEGEKAAAEVVSLVAMNSGSTSTEAWVGRGGATTTAGTGVRTVQQFV